MSTKNEKTKNAEILKFKDELPEDIKERLSPDMKVQFHFWDELNKRFAGRHTRQMIPLFNEVFHRQYPLSYPVKLLSTEYVVERQKEDKKALHSIYADLLVEIGGKDLYHVEWQMKESEGMVLRMMEYDFHIGLNHGLLKNSPDVFPDSQDSAGYEAVLPKSVIIYMESGRKIPNSVSCRIRFPDGTSNTYKVPVLRVQDYNPEMIEKKHLSILIPLMPIRYSRLRFQKEGKRKEKTQRGLTEMVRECIMILEREERNGMLTEMERADLEESLEQSCKYITRNERIVEIIFGEPKRNPAFKFKSELYEEAKAEYEKAEVECKKTKASYEEAKAKYEEAKAGCEKTKAAYEKAEAAIDAIQEDYAAVKAEVSEKNKRIDEMSQEIERLKRQLQLKKQQ